MENNVFDSGLLNDIEEILNSLLNEYVNNELVNKRISTLISFIEEYKTKKVSFHPEMLVELKAYYEELKIIPIEKAKLISEKFRTICKSCFFHDDSCFINIGFLIFKSIERGSFIEPNKIRPSLRAFY